jgi:hypothetical protein
LPEADTAERLERPRHPARYPSAQATCTNRREQDYSHDHSPAPITEPDPSALVCSGNQVGPCATCQRKTHKYGSGGSPLCQWCMAAVTAKGAPVRHTSTHA